MMTLPEGTGGQESTHKVPTGISHSLSIILLTSLLLTWGCSGIISGNNTAQTATPPQTYAISGTISPAAGGAGATVTLSGAANATTAANSSGAYSFSGLSNGSYVVGPSQTGYSFTPATQSVTVNGSNVTGVNFTAAATQAHSATASWSASSSVVSGYNVYRGTVSGGPYTRLNSSLISALTYTDTSVQAAQTYYYVATSVDSGGNESVYSNEVVAVIP
jgi:SdrD B-like domain